MDPGYIDKDNDDDWTKLVEKNKLAKLGDAMAISKSETVTHSLTH